MRDLEVWAHSIYASGSHVRRRAQRSFAKEKKFRLLTAEWKSKRQGKLQWFQQKPASCSSTDIPPARTGCFGHTMQAQNARRLPSTTHYSRDLRSPCCPCPRSGSLAFTIRRWQVVVFSLQKKSRITWCRICKICENSIMKNSRTFLHGTDGHRTGLLRVTVLRGSVPAPDSDSKSCHWSGHHRDWPSPRSELGTEVTGLLVHPSLILLLSSLSRQRNNLLILFRPCRCELRGHSL